MNKKLPQGQVCDVLSGRNSNACVAGSGASAWAAVTSVVVGIPQDGVASRSSLLRGWAAKVLNLMQASHN